MDSEHIPAVLLRGPHVPSSAGLTSEHQKLTLTLTGNPAMAGLQGWCRDLQIRGMNSG